MLYWKDIIPGPKAPSLVYGIVECPKGTQNKYEISKSTNILILDRMLHSSVIYPADYGFIPGTYASDDDPLDILILTAQANIPKTLVECHPIGALIMKDENGLDEKILAVSEHDPHYNVYKDIVQLPEHFLDEIQEFFRTYKALEESSYADVKEWRGREAAYMIIKDAISEFNDRYPDSSKLDPFEK